MYNRYNDLKKFITDSSELKIVNNSEVYVSSEDNYDIVIDLDGQIDKFEKLKPFIIFITKHICELDNIAQRFSSLCHHNDRKFSFELEIVYIDETDVVRLEYWGTSENTVFDVVFRYINNEFVLEKFGMLDNIPYDWEEKLLKNADARFQFKALN